MNIKLYKTPPEYKVKNVQINSFATIYKKNKQRKSTHT